MVGPAPGHKSRGHLVEISQPAMNIPSGSPKQSATFSMSELCKTISASSALFSDDSAGKDGRGEYRYTLWRRGIAPSDLFAPPVKPGYVAFICLNPSTATETTNDNTVTRCINFTKSWGYDTFVMLNLFAFRSTDPCEMLRHASPEGVLNDVALSQVASEAALVVAAWGNHGRHQGRANRVCAWMRRLKVPLNALKLTKEGEPQHPLYLDGDLVPTRYVREIV